jgi:hypothetical protein
MDKIKLVLDEKYRRLASLIKCYEILIDREYQEVRDDYSQDIGDLAVYWFGAKSGVNQIKVIERIHSADEIEFEEPRYKWCFKSPKIYPRYWLNMWDDGDLHFTDDTELAELFTESELKNLLEDTGIPFEAFERVADDE